MMGKSCVDVLRDVTGDNGIETVAEGLEKALNGGGGGGAWVCSVLYDGTNASNTYAEILAAYEEGKTVVLNVYTMPPEYGYQAEVCYLNRVYKTSNNLYFGQPPRDDGLFAKFYMATVNSSNEWTLSEKKCEYYLV